MTNRGAVRPVGVRRSCRSGRRGLVAILLTAIAAVTIALPDAAAAPPAPVPAATASPTASPTEASPTPSATPSPSPQATRRPDPEGDRWVELAVVGGGSLLGAVVLFMLIGGVIRWRNRRRYRD